RIARCSSAPRAKRRAGPARLGKLFLGSSGVRGLRGAPRAWRTWGGGARRTAARPRVSALGAPHTHRSKEEVAKAKLRGGSAPPNGSRLSCGASAGGRKHLALRYELVGAQTYPSSESRPRQLQALVRLLPP